MESSLDTYKHKAFVIENFVTDEIEELNSWCLDNYKKDFFKNANMGDPGTRLTTRYSTVKEGLSFPDAAYRIKSRIIDKLNIQNHKEPSFFDGIVCGIGFEGGDIFSHKDPIWHKDTYTFHCNVLTSKPEQGGNTFVRNKMIPVEEGDLLCFDVSGQKHKVDKIIGEKPRILWVFGFSLPNPGV